MLLLDEIIPSVREAILEEIRYSFNEKWKMYREAMDKLDAEMPKKYY